MEGAEGLWFRGWTIISKKNQTWGKKLYVVRKSSLNYFYSSHQFLQFLQFSCFSHISLCSSVWFRDTAWKVSTYGVFSDPYFPALGLNTERYGVSLRIQSEWMRENKDENNSEYGHFSHNNSYVKNELSLDSLLNSAFIFEKELWKPGFIFSNDCNCWQKLV